MYRTKTEHQLWFTEVVGQKSYTYSVCDQTKRHIGLEPPSHTKVLPRIVLSVGIMNKDYSLEGEKKANDCNPYIEQLNFNPVLVLLSFG